MQSLHGEIKLKPGPLIPVKTITLTNDHLKCNICDFEAKNKGGLATHKSSNRHKENVKRFKERNERKKSNNLNDLIVLENNQDDAKKSKECGGYKLLNELSIDSGYFGEESLDASKENIFLPEQLNNEDNLVNQLNNKDNLVNQQFNRDENMNEIKRLSELLAIPNHNKRSFEEDNNKDHNKLTTSTTKKQKLNGIDFKEELEEPKNKKSENNTSNNNQKERSRQTNLLDFLSTNSNNNNSNNQQSTSSTTNEKTDEEDNELSDPYIKFIEFIKKKNRANWNKYYCEACQSPFSGNECQIKIHKNTKKHKDSIAIKNGLKNTYQCKECDYFCDTFKKLNAHNAIHNDKNDKITKYVCEYCNNYFNSDKDLRKHYQIYHMNVKRFSIKLNDDFLCSNTTKSKFREIFKYNESEIKDRSINYGNNKSNHKFSTESINGNRLTSSVIKQKLESKTDNSDLKEYLNYQVLNKSFIDQRDEKMNQQKSKYSKQLYFYNYLRIDTQLIINFIFDKFSNQHDPLKIKNDFEFKDFFQFLKKIGQGTVSSTKSKHGKFRVMDRDRSYDCDINGFNITFNQTFNGDSRDFIEYALILTIGLSNLPENDQNGTCKIHKEYQNPDKFIKLASDILTDLYLKFKNSNIFSELINLIDKHLKAKKSPLQFKITKKKLIEINDFSIKFNRKGSLVKPHMDKENKLKKELNKASRSKKRNYLPIKINLKKEKIKENHRQIEELKAINKQDVDELNEMERALNNDEENDEEINDNYNDYSEDDEENNDNYNDEDDEENNDNYNDEDNDDD